MNEPPDFDPGVFETLREELGHEDTIEVLKRFLDDTTALVPELDAAGSRSALRRHAHVLKGTSATFGFMRLATRARALESVAETAGEDDLRASLAEVVSAFDECVRIADRRLLQEEG